MEVEEAINNIPRHNIQIAVGDFNAQIGRTAELKTHIGTNSLHSVSNNNGFRSAELAIMYNLVISSTFFPHKRVHKAT
jgi:hypothetical protein